MATLMLNPWISPLLAGWLLDLWLGDPRWLPHPIVGFGRMIGWGERRLNHGGAPRRFWLGTLLTVTLVAGVYLACAVAQEWLWGVHPWAGVGFATLGVFFGLAHRTLITEGRAVFRALDESIGQGRARLAWIVGRDTADLQEPQVRTAVFETMAENLSDGVVAPLFYYAIGGVPAMMAYKMINTLDSMIGHRDARHEWFGKTAARLDDAANLVPARLTALLMVLVTGSARGLRFVLRYGRAHASPNSGYPEAALAGILDLRFGGPLRYDGEWVEKPWIGENPRPILSEEIGYVVRLNHAVCAGCVALIVVLHWPR
ncbi:MAG: adenosylcobinamide-phosphate synthase CbiB [Verrucomicrobia bacterium]|nr:adenosylcobinamide-phosphate synthase CbiB [Verrucomicrobiota bacterium]